MMKIKNLKIGTQLRLGYAAMLVFVLVLGLVSYQQADEISQQTEIMHNHPLKVRSAIGDLETDILSMIVATRDLMLAKTDQEKQDAVQMMELAAADAHLQFGVLKENYLGPAAHVDEAYSAFVVWKTARDEDTRLTLSGNIDQVKESILSTGKVGVYREQLMGRVKTIDDFAKNKAESLYDMSSQLKTSLNRQLILLVSVILLLSILINNMLLHNIRKPLGLLTETTQAFHGGNLSARSAYVSENEFGILSASFNSLAERIQEKTVLDEKVTSLASLMLSEYDTRKFFQAMLTTLARHTGSQMAAIYLLSDDKKSYEHYESTGLDAHARQSFPAGPSEGEFAAALTSRMVQHIRSIPEDTRFVFHTVSETFIPREIITIPIQANHEVIAVISLAGITAFSPDAVELISRIEVVLSARIEGILAFQKMKEFSGKMELQNAELEAQKTELSSQANELTEQNMELEVQKKQLDQASQLKSTFLSNMSHELRTPLNSVIALSGVLNRKLKNQIPEDEYSYLEVIERNGKHLLALINDVLDISRIEAGREEIEITTINACHLVDEVVSMIEPLAVQKNIQLLKAKGDCSITLTSDAGKCRHILQNLIGNAVKFTEQGQVEIDVLQVESHLEIAVKDSGIGVSEAHQLHIFDEFRQADGSTSRRFGGTGLGLAIAKKYANLLGGTIAVSSSSGTGSVFTLSLPLRYELKNKIIPTGAYPAFVPQKQRIPERIMSDGSGKTILLVEDSEPAIIQLKDILEESGYHLLVAHDGGEALEIISHTLPDAMILDLMMPGIDGFEVLRSLRNAESTAAIPVLVLTARQLTKDDLRLLKRNNVHQLIQKGDVNRLELLHAVAGMVGSPAEETPKPDRKPQEFEGRPVILVVEDNADNMLTVKAVLGSSCIMLEAVNGIEGIAMAKKHRPNLILMDIALPGMDGIEAFKSIRNNPHLQHIPVLALTASAMTSDREIILAHGFDAYIAKPIDEPTFFKTINETLYGN